MSATKVVCFTHVYLQTGGLEGDSERVRAINVRGGEIHLPSRLEKNTYKLLANR